LSERRWPAVLLLLAFSAFLFFYGLTAGELYRTETLRAIIAAEFLRSGNWVVPMLYGEPLLTKPPGMYAAIALASWPFGQVTEWTARLPSALAATATLLMIYGYFRRQLGRRGGLVAAAILPASFMWLDKATAAEIDMLQVAWVTAAIVCFLRALEMEEAGRQSPRRWLWWLAALLCVAGGVLTKWTAPAFFYGTVIPLLWWRGRLRLLFGRHHLVSAAVGAGLCLAWGAAAIYLAGWQAFYGTVSREALMRLSPYHHHRAYPWLETLAHPFRVFGAALPWSVFALLTLRPGFARGWDERGRKLLQALHCWTWPNLLFWSVIPEHAVRHSFPLAPGIAGLAAMVWIGWLRQGRARSFNREPTASAGVALAVGSRLNDQAGRVLVGMLILWLVVKLAYVHAVIPARDQHRDLRLKAGQIAARVPDGETLYLFHLKDEGIMFYYGRTVRRLPGPGQLPSSAGPLYCILVQTEWQGWPCTRPAKELLHLCDGQGDPIVLVWVDGS
jgi:4-amino-4-deoxy-L-arabinose transferase-like glycosyltransferase